MNVTELAEYLRIHRTTIYRLLKAGKLPAFRVGSDWRFNVEAIDDWRLDLQIDQIGADGLADFDPVAKARANELREQMKHASEAIAKDPARMRTAERERFALQVKNFVRQAEREQGREKGSGAERDEGLER
jgi:excisionase family DNA binding protein